jgi:hypothetical protein
MVSPGGTPPYHFQCGAIGATPEADHSAPVGRWRQDRDEFSNDFILPHQNMAETSLQSRDNSMVTTVGHSDPSNQQWVAGDKI